MRNRNKHARFVVTQCDSAAGGRGKEACGSHVQELQPAGRRHFWTCTRQVTFDPCFDHPDLVCDFLFSLFVFLGSSESKKRFRPSQSRKFPPFDLGTKLRVKVLISSRAGRTTSRCRCLLCGWQTTINSACATRSFCLCKVKQSSRRFLFLFKHLLYCSRRWNLPAGIRRKQAPAPPVLAAGTTFKSLCFFGCCTCERKRLCFGSGTRKPAGSIFKIHSLWNNIIVTVLTPSHNITA